MNLERVRAQVPVQAQKGLDNAIANANQNFEKAQERISVQNRQTISEIEEKINSGTVHIKEKVQLKNGGN